MTGRSTDTHAASRSKGAGQSAIKWPRTGGCGESKRVSSRERKKVPGTSGGVEGGGSSFCQSSELWGSLTPRAPGPLGLPEQRQLVTGEGDDTVCPQGYRRITTKGFQVILAI